MMSSAVYLRVSTKDQTEASQRLAIERWLAGNGTDAASCRWYVDHSTGDNMDRPAFQQLQAAVFAGEICTIVVYKIDRISRSLRDGINTLCGWLERGTRVVAVTQQLDFSGATGKLIAAVLLAVAEMEQETRRDRQRAGIAAARERGQAWGGSKPGRCLIGRDQHRAIHLLAASGTSKAEIARIVGVSRPTVVKYLRTGVRI